MNNYEMLFTPMKIGEVTIPNRIVMTAMGVDVSAPDGRVTPDTVAYYTARAKGGTGLIITEYCRVNESDGACATGQLSLSHDRYIPRMIKLTESVHKHGSKIFVQLHHLGRQSVPVFPTFWPALEKAQLVWPGVWDQFYKTLSSVPTDTSNTNPEVLKKQQRFLKPVLAPSVLPPEEDDGVLSSVKTKAFTTKEIKKLILQFIDAAQRAKMAGFDGVELHAAHGYLFEQFLSPWTNRRTDEYGGNEENRRRILKEIIEGIHERCGSDFPVTVRLTVDEFYEKVGHPERGLHLEEGIRIAKALESYGADALNVSIAGQDTSFLVTESLRYAPGWRNYLTHQVKDAVNIPVIGVSVTRTPQQAEQQLQNGDQDFIGLGRPLLADPDWAKKAKDGHSDSITRCIGCLYCMDRFAQDMLNGNPIECAVNPATCHEREFSGIKKDGNGRKVIIAGAGVSGLYAAMLLSRRKFDVTVYERNSCPGGQVNIADKPPYKERLSWCVEDLVHQAEKAGAKIVCNAEVDFDLITREDPYAVLIASGTGEIVPGIEGIEQNFVSTVEPILSGRRVVEDQNVVIIGSGMTGLETAEYLLEKGNRVCVVEMADRIAPGAVGINAMEIKKILVEANVQLLPGKKLEKIGDHSVTLSDTRDNSISELSADTVVLSLGVRADHSLKESLRGRARVYEIGTCAGPGRIAEAIRSAYDTSKEL